MSGSVNTNDDWMAEGSTEGGLKKYLLVGALKSLHDTPFCQE
jgi:hypothetical protein